MLTATALVLLMTPGLSFFYGGMVRPKNVISTMLQSFISMGVVSLIWVTVGFSLAFGDSIGGVIGNPMTFLMFKGVAEAPDAASQVWVRGTAVEAWFQARVSDEYADRPELFLPDGIHPAAEAQPRIVDTVWAGLRPLLAAKETKAARK